MTKWITCGFILVALYADPVTLIKVVFWTLGGSVLGLVTWCLTWAWVNR